MVNTRVYFANFFGFASNLEKFVAVWDFEPSKKDEVALSKVKLSFFYIGIYWLVAVDWEIYFLIMDIY